jgi:hypothetical protein
MATYEARTRRWTRIEYEKLIDLGIFRPGESDAWEDRPGGPT